MAGGALKLQVKHNGAWPSPGWLTVTGYVLRLPRDSFSPESLV